MLRAISRDTPIWGSFGVERNPVTGCLAPRGGNDATSKGETSVKKRGNIIGMKRKGGEWEGSVCQSQRLGLGPISFLLDTDRAKLRRGLEDG